MEDSNNVGHATRADGAQQGSDEVLSRLLGGNLQAATVRLVLYLALASAIAGAVAVLA